MSLNSLRMTFFGTKKKSLLKKMCTVETRFSEVLGHWGKLFIDDFHLSKFRENYQNVGGSLQSWSWRGLTLIRRILIIKAIAIPKM